MGRDQDQPNLLMPTEQKLTAAEAAKFLKMSTAFVPKEIKTGRLLRQTDFNRQVMLDDLLQYSQRMRIRQAIALDRMAENAHDLGLVYRQLDEVRFFEPSSDRDTLQGTIF